MGDGLRTLRVVTTDEALLAGARAAAAGLEGWEVDPDKPIKARVCLTGLHVGFDFIVESWEYGCHTEVEERRRAPLPRDPLIGR